MESQMGPPSRLSILFKWNALNIYIGEFQAEKFYHMVRLLTY